MNRFVATPNARAVIAERVRNFILSALPGKSLDITVGPHRKTRSGRQNNSLWGVAYPPICAELGYDPQELHEVMCGEYWGWMTYEVMGLRKKRPRRTTTTDENGDRDVLNTVDMMAFYEFVQRKGAEFGVYVPSPNEQEMAA